MTMPPSKTAQLRQKLNRAFDDSALSAFCLDYFPEVYNEFSQGMRKNEKITLLLDHCRRQPTDFDSLLPYIDKKHSDDKQTQPTTQQGAEESKRQFSAPNPFGYTGRITDPQRFFDRKGLLHEIFEELRKGNSVSLVGERQIGKSSVLSMICEWGAERLNLPRQAFAYLSLQWVRNEEEFYEALCDELGIKSCRGYQLTRALRGKRIVLCVDRIEKMTWEGFTRHLQDHLHGLADGNSAPLTLVLASRLPLTDLLDYSSKDITSPLDTSCYQLDIGPFPPKTARAFLLDRLRGTGVTFSETELTQILRSTQCHPAKLQRAAALLFNRYQGERQ